MKNTCLAFLGAVLSAYSSLDCHAQANESAILGRAPFAILHPNFPCQAYQETSKDISPYAISFLWNTFGHSFNCLDQELQNPNLKLVQVHLLNGSCLRNKSCGNYEVFSGYNIKSLSLAISNKDPHLKDKMESSAQDLANYLLPRLKDTVACYINPILESDLSRENSLIVQDWILPHFKNRCNFVWNPLGSNPGKPIQGAAVSEGHGSKLRFEDRRCIANNDGETIRDKEAWLKFFEKNRECVAVFAWSLSDNCLSTQQEWRDPRDRECSLSSEFKEMHEAIKQASP